MEVTSMPDMRRGYVSLCRDVLAGGMPVKPRGIETREFVGAMFILHDITKALPLGVNRKLSLPVAAVEAAQLIAGRSFPDLMTRINPTFLRFQDKPGFFHGAYGPRIHTQVQEVVRMLNEDPDSRQAVVTIYDGQRDHVASKDLPCTLSLQFFIRGGRLFMQANMRSNDVWWGTAYDVFQFTQLQMTIATVLGVGFGDYIHTAGSLHAYVQDAEAIAGLRYEKDYAWPYIPQGLAEPGDTIEQAQHRAERMLGLAWERRFVESMGDTLTEAEAWYLKRLTHNA